jgi:hypothetical protein
MLEKIKQKISLLLPSRGRIEKLRLLLKNLESQTCDLNKLEIILLLDDDDVESHAVGHDQLNIKKIIQARSSMGQYNTNCFEASSGDIIILINDDMLIQTQGWDEKIREFDAKFSDKVYLAYPNDLFKGKCTFPILSRKTCELLKYPFPIQYKGAFIDTHLFDIFERLRKKGFNRTIFLEDVVFEHRHYRSGKAQFDLTYKNRNRFGDDQVFVDLIAMRQENAKTLLAQIEGSEYRLQTLNASSISLYQGSIFFLPFKLVAAFFKDYSLPLKWRSYLSLYFFARTVFFKFSSSKKQLVNEV